MVTCNEKAATHNRLGAGAICVCPILIEMKAQQSPRFDSAVPHTWLEKFASIRKEE